MADINIAGTLNAVANDGDKTNPGTLARTSQIKDEAKGKKQSVINAEVETTLNEAQYNIAMLQTQTATKLDKPLYNIAYTPVVCKELTPGSTFHCELSITDFVTFTYGGENNMEITPTCVTPANGGTSIKDISATLTSPKILGGNFVIGPYGGYYANQLNVMPPTDDATKFSHVGLAQLTLTITFTQGGVQKSKEMPVYIMMETRRGLAYNSRAQGEYEIYDIPDYPTFLSKEKIASNISDAVAAAARRSFVTAVAYLATDFATLQSEVQTHDNGTAYIGADEGDLACITKQEPYNGEYSTVITYSASYRNSANQVVGKDDEGAQLVWIATGREYKVIHGSEIIVTKNAYLTDLSTNEVTAYGQGAGVWIDDSEASNRGFLYNEDAHLTLSSDYFEIDGSGAWRLKELDILDAIARENTNKFTPNGGNANVDIRMLMEDAVSKINGILTELFTLAKNSTVVHKTGSEVIEGIKTFYSIPLIPNSSPTNAMQAANKGYVDSQVVAVNYGNKTVLLRANNSKFLIAQAKIFENIDGHSPQGNELITWSMLNVEMTGHFGTTIDQRYAIVNIDTIDGEPYFDNHVFTWNPAGTYQATITRNGQPVGEGTFDILIETIYAAGKDNVLGTLKNSQDSDPLAATSYVNGMIEGAIRELNNINITEIVADNSDSIPRNAQIEIWIQDVLNKIAGLRGRTTTNATDIEALRTAINGKQAALNRTVSISDTVGSNSLTDKGGTLSLGVKVTTAAPVADASIMPATNQGTLRSILQAIIDRLYYLQINGGGGGNGGGSATENITAQCTIATDDNLEVLIQPSVSLTTLLPSSSYPLQPTVEELYNDSAHTQWFDAAVNVPKWYGRLNGVTLTFDVYADGRGYSVEWNIYGSGTQADTIDLYTARLPFNFTGTEGYVFLQIKDNVMRVYFNNDAYNQGTAFTPSLLFGYESPFGRIDTSSGNVSLRLSRIYVESEGASVPITLGKKITIQLPDAPTNELYNLNIAYTANGVQGNQLVQYSNGTTAGELHAMAFDGDTLGTKDVELPLSFSLNDKTITVKSLSDALTQFTVTNVVQCISTDKLAAALSTAQSAQSAAATAATQAATAQSKAEEAKRTADGKVGTVTYATLTAEELPTSATSGTKLIVDGTNSIFSVTFPASAAAAAQTYSSNNTNVIVTITE